MLEQCYWDILYWIFHNTAEVFTEVFENGSLIYRNGRAANMLRKTVFFATGGRITCMHIFSSPEHEVLMVSYCDQSLSVIRRLCVVNFLL